MKTITQLSNKQLIEIFSETLEVYEANVDSSYETKSSLLIQTGLCNFITNKLHIYSYSGEFDTILRRLNIKVPTDNPEDYYFTPGDIKPRIKLLKELIIRL